MSALLGLVLISFIFTSVFMVPFINLLFYLKKRFERFTAIRDRSDTPIHDKLMKGDEGTPHGGGILLTLILAVLSFAYSYFVPKESLVYLRILIFTLLSFGLIGLVDDIKWVLTRRRGKFHGLSRKVLFFAQIILSLFIGFLLYHFIGLNNVYIPGLGNFVIGAWYIPLAAFVIISFSNAYNISDGLDGLSTGLLAICLFAFLALASTTLDISIASFIGIWIGTLFAYLYFNVWPARIFLGDMGAFAFGATLGVVGLLTGKIVALAVIGAVYIIIVASSLIQMFSKKFFGRKVFPIAPIHMMFKYIGWEEPKIVMRFWLAGSIFAILGLWLSLMSR